MTCPKTWGYTVACDRQGPQSALFGSQEAPRQWDSRVVDVVRPADKVSLLTPEPHLPPFSPASTLWTLSPPSLPLPAPPLRPAYLFRFLLWRTPLPVSPLKNCPPSGFFLQEPFSSGFQLRLRPRLPSRCGETWSRVPVPGSDGKGPPPQEVTTEVPLTGA